MAEGYGPTARFVDWEGKQLDLAAVCDAMRHGVEIRNRSHLKRLQKNRCVAHVHLIVCRGSGALRYLEWCRAPRGILPANTLCC